MDTGIARALPGHGHTRDPGPDLAGTLVWSLKRALPGLSRGGVCVETGASPGGGRSPVSSLERAPARAGGEKTKKYGGGFRLPLCVSPLDRSVLAIWPSPLSYRLSVCVLGIFCIYVLQPGSVRVPLARPRSRYTHFRVRVAL